LTISQAANTGGNALTISGGIISGGGSQTLTFSGPGNMKVTTTALSDGSGQLSVNVAGGALTLNTANTYTGATTVTNGFLQVNGSLAAGSMVTVGAGGQLGGTGVINGATTIQAGGTLSPGGSLSTLTFNSALTLAAAATSFFEISKSPTTNDVAKISGAADQRRNPDRHEHQRSRHRRSATASSCSTPPVTTAAFANAILPALPSGLAWNTSALNTAGVLSVMATPHPVIGQVKISGSGLVFSGGTGAGYASFYLLDATNFSTPVSNWTRLLTNQFDAGGNFNFTNPCQSRLAARDITCCKSHD
jgi:autotransporter-associated beta strand protein